MRTSDWQRRVARTVLVTFTTCMVGCGGSQGQGPTSTTTVLAETSTTIPVSPPTMPPPPAAPPPTLPADAPQKLGEQQLRDLVAPVALYPDVVLASLLPATTNADQVHDAAQWIGQAQHVEHIPEDRGWDGSIIGLLQFPDVLRWLDENPAWTDEMGQAVTYQQGDVLNAIQDFRRLARDAGNLKSNQYQTVRGAPDQDIQIEPARKDVVYVPSYDPVAATQPQPAPASSGVNPWLAFGGGVAVGALGAWALYSIFDDDDDHDTHHHYYGGGGRHINQYNNYYYSGGRRPPPSGWTPRPRPYRPYGQRVQQPRRLHVSTQAAQPIAHGSALRPPMTRPAAETKRENTQPRQEQQRHQQQKQEQQQEKRQRQQEQKQTRPQQQSQPQQRQKQQPQQKQNKSKQQGKQTKDKKKGQGKNNGKNGE